MICFTFPAGMSATKIGGEFEFTDISQKFNAQAALKQVARNVAQR